MLYKEKIGPFLCSLSNRCLGWVANVGKLIKCIAELLHVPCFVEYCVVAVQFIVAIIRLQHDCEVIQKVGTRSIGNCVLWWHTKLTRANSEWDTFFLPMGHFL